MINEQRLRDYFLELIQIDSEARSERQIALRLKADLEALGAAVEEDDAGARFRSNSGNLIGRLTGTSSQSSPPMLLCAHMDTVVPGKGIKPIIDGDIIHSDGSTILGGDDKTGIAALMEALRSAKEQNVPLGDLEIVFTICEERGLLGAIGLDASKLRSKFGLVFDSDEPGVLFTKAPAANHLEWHIYGQEAHAGMAPERGISAIKIASEAIAQMQVGRIDFETTANIGVINGGMATNIIPNHVEIHGETRSRSIEKLDAQTRHMDHCFHDAAARYSLDLDGKTIQARVESKIERAYDLMNVPDNAPIVKMVQQAARNIGVEITLKAMGGACDANIFNGKGISCANLGTGMRDIHTTSEWVDVRDLMKAGNMIFELLRLHGSGAAV